jgi:hypothetical protein
MGRSKLAMLASASGNEMVSLGKVPRPAIGIVQVFTFSHSCDRMVL